jgi:PIN domain nuclease of toxin-antitoxin system
MGDLRLLLDTHVLLWMLSEPERLSSKCQEAVESVAHQLLVSTVSLFEISNKVRIGKLTHPGPLLTQTEWTLSKLRADLLPLSGTAAILAGQFQVPHRDPFDRLLAAQAITATLPLVSSDPAFRQFDDLEVLW